MNIIILALGSRGDVMPYATLGKGLAAAGHNVTLATFENFESLISAHGLAYHPVRGDIQAILNGSAGKDLAESGRSVWRMWRAISRSFGKMARTMAQDFSGLLSTPCDVLINQLPGGLYGSDLAEKLGVPLIMAGVMPLSRTRHFPMVGFPPTFSHLPGYNRLSHPLAEQLVWQLFRPAINRWRKLDLGLPPTPMFGQMARLAQPDVPFVYGFSRHVVERPADWAANIHLTGYWFPETGGWQPPDALDRFLSSGPPPIFLGFGSMPVRHPEAATRAISAAVQQSGQRAILQKGWAGLGQSSLPDSIHLVDYVPYEWLFPRMRAVVHHGGSGTTGMGLRAGAPNIIVPFLFDQFYWGRRVAQLGAGPQPVPFKQLSAQKLARAIDQVLTQPLLGHRAAEIGRQIQSEDGVNAAVQLIESLV